MEGDSHYDYGANNDITQDGELQPLAQATGDSCDCSQHSNKSCVHQKGDEDDDHDDEMDAGSDAVSADTDEEDDSFYSKHSRRPYAWDTDSQSSHQKCILPHPLQSSHMMIPAPVVPLNIAIHSYCPASDSEEVLIHELPSEIVLTIFAHLSNEELCRFVAPVCKRWYQLAYDASLWTALVFRRTPHMKPAIACRLISLSFLLHSVDLHGHSSLAVYALPTIAANCRFVRKLDLGFCDVLDSSLLALLASRCPYIADLNVEGCCKITPDSVREIVKCQRLQSLNLSHCTMLTDESIIALTSSLPKLQYLNIDGISWIHDRLALADFASVMRCRYSRPRFIAY